MSSMINNLVQVIICSGILYANYHLLLRNKKFHLYNRYYLLGAVTLSTVIPLINIPIYFTDATANPSAIFQTLTHISSVASFPVTVRSGVNMNPFKLESVLLVSYVLIACSLFYRVLVALLSISKLLRRYKVERQSDLYFVNTTEPGTPFSFFKWLFWNKKIDLRSENGRQMFRHEVFHIRQKHSWDLTFMEIVSAVFWVNPFFHLIKKELTTIHEFLADEFATKEKDKWTYAELLLMQVLDTSQYRLVNAFFHNQIKRRIAMITSSQIPKYQFFRKLMILPVGIIVFALFAFKMEHYAEFKFAPSKPAIAPPGPDPKFLAAVSDTTKPKAKRKTTAEGRQKEMNEKNFQDENEAIQFKMLMEEKQIEMQKAQQEFQLRMMEKQRETQAAQEQFRQMMEATQQQAEQERQQRFKQLMEQRQEQAEKYEEEFKKLMAMKQQDAEKNQEEFKKMIDARQRQAEQEGQQTFKPLLDEKQKEAQKLQQEFNQMMMMRQTEAEKSQEEFRKLLEQRQQEMQKLQLEFQKKMMGKRKQVI